MINIAYLLTQKNSLNQEKLLDEAIREQKILLAYRKFIHTSTSRCRKHRHEHKITLFTPISNFDQHSNHSKFFTRFIFYFNIHSNKIDQKERLLQYSSSSRKKQCTNTIHWIVKKESA